MKLNQVLLPAGALCAVALLFGTGETQAFTELGFALGLAQRGVRVFDNFTDASANNNVTPDTNWPGYTGVELAIWKAASEWGSQLHGGTGAGDPLQTVGSGGANFDITWQGNATGVGDVGDNICSEIPGSDQGTLAFTESFLNGGGWRMRFYATWAWHDGPDSIASGWDIQGIATHEYGHALGLGHSLVNGATMVGGAAGPATSLRSIAADDIAGVKAVYGVKAATKPTISSLSVGSGVVTIGGTNFSATNNEVWFTQAGTGGTGLPVKVSGVSSNGTSIAVTIPAAAGKGDVLVHKSGTGGANLSNAWPFDPNTGPGCPIPIVYCTAKISSSLCSPAIGFSGIPSDSFPGGFSITTTGMESGTTAIDFFGTTGQATVPFQGGLICAASPIYRLFGKVTGGAGPCTGSISYTLQDVKNHGAGGPFVVPGGLVNIQSWGRDLADPFGSSLSNALEITVCP